MTLRCVTFDLDDTLWECGPILLAAEEAFYDWIKGHYAPIAERYSLVDLVAHRRRFFQRFPDMAHDLPGLRRRWLRHLADSFGFGPELVDTGFRVFREHRNAVTLFEEAHAVLDGMRERDARFVYGSDHSISTAVAYGDFLYSLEVYREHRAK